MLGYLQRGMILIFSDILSLITVALCLVAKVPQIKTLYRYKSARGEWKKKMPTAVESNLQFKLCYSQCRHQFVITLSGVGELHDNDDVQLLLRLCHVIVYGVPSVADTRIRAHFPCVEVQGFAYQQYVRHYSGVFCDSVGFWIQHFAEIPVGLPGGMLDFIFPACLILYGWNWPLILLSV